MQARRLLLLLLVALLEAVPVAAAKKTGGAAGAPAAGTKAANPAASALGKLRGEMLKYYCSGGQHVEVPPCKTHAFMTKMRAASSPDEKKKILTARQEEMKKLSAEDRKKTAMAAREGYSAMYTDYCTKEFPGKNAEVCTNALLKKLYGKKA